MGVRRLAEWMGFVEDSRYNDPEEVSEELSEVIYEDEEPSVVHEPSRVTQLPARTGATERRRPVVAQPAAPEVADISRIVSLRPQSYNEARAIGENFRDGIPVIMNVSDMEAGEAKRLVDFAAGLTYGLRGSIERISVQVFLLCPQNLVVGPEDKEMLASGGFFNQS